MAATLLLADDSATMQRVVDLAFALEGIRVITAEDGEAAAARLAADRPDIVLADAGLPGLDGYALATRVKQSPGLASVPVLLLAGAFDPVDEARARAAGCDGVVVKPFEPLHLVRLVTGLLAGERPDALWPAEPSEGPATVLEVPAPAAAEAATEIAWTEAALDDATAEVLEFASDDLDDAFARQVAVEIALPDAEALPALSVLPAATDEDGLPALELSLDAMAGEGDAAVSWDLPEPAGDLVAPPVMPPVAARPPAVVTPSLADAFAALLAAERAQAAAAPASPAPEGVPEALVEDVVRRVLARMTDEMVRTLVMETAERFIREELDRMKP